jgi:4a-hydroxytetrahydrobiopterin dehydratase
VNRSDEMSDLANKKCVECSLGGIPFTPDEIKDLLPMISTEWEVNKNKKINRVFKFKNFKVALLFVNKVGDIAEEEGHHPDIELSWGRVRITLTTHKVQGLTENDFIMAAKIDKLL